jgi:hypothetical protein
VERGEFLHEESRQPQEGSNYIDTTNTCKSQKVEEFAKPLEESLPGPADAGACSGWENSGDAAMSTLGKKTTKSADWFEANTPTHRREEEVH